MVETGRRAMRLPILLSTTGVLWVAVALDLGCVGGPNEQGTAELGTTLQEPLVLNSNPNLPGTYVNQGGQGPIQEVRLLPCWMDVTFSDGSYLEGNYAAFGVDGAYDLTSGGRFAGTGMLMMQRPVDAGPASELWILNLAHRDFGTGELKGMTLGSITTNDFGETTSLDRVAGVEVAAGQDWCLSAPLPGLARGMDGQAVIAPPGSSFANESLIGIWRADNGYWERENTIKEVVVGPCFIQVNYWRGIWLKANYMAYTMPSGDDESDRSGVLNMRIFEQGLPQEGNSMGTYNLTELAAWGVRTTGGESLHLSEDHSMSFGETFVRVGPYVEGPDERWCFPR